MFARSIPKPAHLYRHGAALHSQSPLSLASWSVAHLRQPSPALGSVRWEDSDRTCRYLVLLPTKLCAASATLMAVCQLQAVSTTTG